MDHPGWEDNWLGGAHCCGSLALGAVLRNEAAAHLWSLSAWWALYPLEEPTGRARVCPALKDGTDEATAGVRLSQVLKGARLSSLAPLDLGQTGAVLVKGETRQALPSNMG